MSEAVKKRLLEQLENVRGYSDEAIEVLKSVIEEYDNIDQDNIMEEVDSRLIYYYDCWRYLENSHITDFEEAYQEFGTFEVCGIATYFLSAEALNLATELDYDEEAED